MKGFLQYFLLLLLGLILFFFLLTPIYLVVEQGLRYELLKEVFQNEIYVSGLMNSLKIALVTTAMVFIIALPLALVFDRYQFKGKSLTHLLILLPMILPPFVGALGFQQLLGHFGIINTILNSWGVERIDFLAGSGRFWSVCMIEALHLYPILYLNLVAALGNLDPAMEEAAQNLGANRWTRLKWVTLPLLKNGIFAGGSIVLIWSFTELGTPLMFGYNRTATVQIFNGLTELESNPLPYTLVALMLVLSAVLYLVTKLFFRTNAATLTKGSSAIEHGTILRGKWQYWPLVLFLGVTLLAALPHIALILGAFSPDWYATILPERFTLRNFEEALSNPMVVPSIINSLKYSLLATGFALTFGFFGALANIRWKLRGAQAVDLLSMLPLAVPGIVIAFGFLALAARYQWAAAIFRPDGNPLLLLGAAYAIRRLPYVIRSATAGLQQTPEDLEQSGRNLGASAGQVMMKLTIPLILANLTIGALFAFSFSMLEVSDSLILAQKSAYYPITKAIFELSQILGSGPAVASAFGVWAMFFLGATLYAAGKLMGKKLGNIFQF